MDGGHLEVACDCVTFWFICNGDSIDFTSIVIALYFVARNTQPLQSKVMDRQIVNCREIPMWREGRREGLKGEVWLKPPIWNATTICRTIVREWNFDLLLKWIISSLSDQLFGIGSLVFVDKLMNEMESELTLRFSGLLNFAASIWE